MINVHLKKYPLMQLEDKLKLIFQGQLGPRHLKMDEELIMNNLMKEYNIAKDIDYKYDMIEEISDKYVRVYLKPYYEKYHDFSKLAKAFNLSLDIVNDEEVFINKVKELINLDNKEYINKYLSSNYLISHSKIYKDNYHPFYLVIHKNFISVIGE